MKLALFNGSPRGNTSNTKILLTHFCKGFEEFNGEVLSIDYLISSKNIQSQVENFKSAEAVLLAFPLYTDSMPGIVKNFIEEIGEYDGTGKKILFLVQSGFPEGVHSTYVEKYLKWLANKWNFEYTGTIIKPGVEGIKMKPDSWNKKIFSNMVLFGKDFAENGVLNKKQLIEFAKPYRLTPIYRSVFRLLSLTGITNYYWNYNLKKNNAFEHRFDAPYFKK